MKLYEDLLDIQYKLYLVEISVNDFCINRKSFPWENKTLSSHTGVLHQIQEGGTFLLKRKYHIFRYFFLLIERTLLRNLQISLINLQQNTFKAHFLKIILFTRLIPRSVI